MPDVVMNNSSPASYRAREALGIALRTFVQYDRQPPACWYGEWNWVETAAWKKHNESVEVRSGQVAPKKCPVPFPMSSDFYILLRNKEDFAKAKMLRFISLQAQGTDVGNVLREAKQEYKFWRQCICRFFKYRLHLEILESRLPGPRSHYLPWEEVAPDHRTMQRGYVLNLFHALKVNPYNFCTDFCVWAQWKPQWENERTAIYNPGPMFVLRLTDNLPRPLTELDVLRNYPRVCLPGPSSIPEEWARICLVEWRGRECFRSAVDYSDRVPWGPANSDDGHDDDGPDFEEEILPDLIEPVSD
jgi:hypothetical protein